MADSHKQADEGFEIPISVHQLVLEDGSNIEEHLVGVFDVNGLIMIRSLERRLLRGDGVALTRTRLFRALALERWSEDHRCVLESGQVSKEPASHNPEN